MPMVVYTEEECIEAQQQGEREGLERGQQVRDRLAAENEKLRAALKPFAVWGSMWPSPEDNLTVVAHLHVNSRYEAHLGTEDFRRASAALSE